MRVDSSESLPLYLMVYANQFLIFYYKKIYDVGKLVNKAPQVVLRNRLPHLEDGFELQGASAPVQRALLGAGGEAASARS